MIDINALNLSGLNPTQQARVEKYANIIGSGGTLDSTQEARLGKFSGITGQDLASAFSYTPVTQKYETKLQAFTPASISNASSTIKAAPSEIAWAPITGDLYQNINPYQEQKLGKLAERYVSGELEGKEGKITKLEKLLGKAGLEVLSHIFHSQLHIQRRQALGLSFHKM